MIRRAVREDPTEHDYWEKVHTSSSFKSSPVKMKRMPSRMEVVTDISDIDTLSNLAPLQNTALYAPGTHVYNQLCALVTRTGSYWGLALDPHFFSSKAGRALIAISTMNAATRKIHHKKRSAKKYIVPSFSQLMPAYFWAPLVHRLNDSAIWTQFYRDQHRLNCQTLINSGLAVPLVRKSGRYEFGDFRFKSDNELEELWDKLEMGRMASGGY